MAISGSQVAYKYAMSGVMRSGTSRSNYTTPKVFLTIAGTHYATGRAVDSQLVLQDTLSITETHGSPTTATFRVRGFTPSDGQEVIITLGSKNTLDRQFAGTILTTTAGYEGVPSNKYIDVSAIDYSWQLTRRRVTKRYTAQLATAIAQDLVSQVTGFTSANVASGLATIDEISFTFDTVLSALKQVADRIGAAPPSVDYFKDVHLALTAASGTNPVTIADGVVPTLTDIKLPSDMSQQITRAYVQGGGVNALAPGTPGDTMLAVNDVSWYSLVGGQVMSGPQRIAYTGVNDGSGGAVAGPGVAPSAKPSNIPLGPSGSAVTSGAHYWAYTFVTGAGESLPSPISNTMTMRTMSTPAAPDSATTAHIAGGPSVGVTVNYALTISALPQTGETATGPAVTIVGDGTCIDVRYTITSDMVGAYVNVYRDDNGAGYNLLSSYGPVSAASVGVVGGVTDTNTSLASFPPVSSGGAIERASLSGVAVGPTGTTSRKVYRTAAAGSQLKLVATIANNTATTYTDSTPDGSLGANVPTSDTSGLTTTVGQVTAGSTTLLTSGAGSFSATGGWAVVGNQCLRYTGISTNTLTGIPASGTGAILSTIPYGTIVTPAPQLTGIPASGTGAILYTIAKGDPVNILVQVDDVTAEATVAALIGGSDDGVIEDYQSDGRISETEATARATATLEAHSALALSVSGSSRDNNMRGGRTLAVNITAPRTVNSSFALQSVTTSNFQTAIFPTRAFQAAATEFGFSDLIRVLRQER